jgi:hypothetical protein
LEIQFIKYYYYFKKFDLFIITVNNHIKYKWRSRIIEIFLVGDKILMVTKSRLASNIANSKLSNLKENPKDSKLILVFKRIEATILELGN